MNHSREGSGTYIVPNLVPNIDKTRVEGLQEQDVFPAMPDVRHETCCLDLERVGGCEGLPLFPFKNRIVGQV